MYERWLTARILEALADTPVVCLVGARQTGKTTLVRSLAAEAHPARYLTFDDAATLAAASSDPAAFVAGLEGPVVLDEVQRVPALFPAIKKAVDEDRRPGRFLLTGSANVLVLPELSSALVGRMEILTLWPLSQGEIDGTREDFVDRLFAEEPPGGGATGEQAAALDRALVGGFPEIQTRSPARRAAWFDSYVTTILQRDVRDLSRIEGLATLPRLLELLAHRATWAVNFSEISRDAGTPQTTLKRYMALLEHTFLLRSIPAWAKNPSKRLARSPKLLVTDSGLLAHLAGWSAERLRRDRQPVGPLLEDFVLMELIKQAGWSDRIRTRLYHFRTADGREVDAVLEDGSGRVVGIEVKASVSLGKNDFRGLEALRDAAGERLHRGVVLYGGTEALTFGPGLHALPLTSVWTSSRPS